MLNLFARALLPFLTALLVLGGTVTHAQTLRWASQGDILTLDPHAQDHAATNAILAHVYEGLVRRNKDYEIEAALATQWTEVSPTRVRFFLRRGVKYHDGSPFTSDDVVFSFERVRQPNANHYASVSGIAEVQRIDSHTIDLISSKPNPLLLRNLVNFAVMSKAWVQKNSAYEVLPLGTKRQSFAALQANGTGQYRLESWKPDERIVLQRNQEWWGSHGASPKAVVYLPINSSASRVAALLSGQIDLLTSVPPRDAEQIERDGRFVSVSGTEMRTMFIALDVFSAALRYGGEKGSNPFSNPLVRKALSLAIDRAAIQRAIMNGASIPAGLITPPGTFGYGKDIDVVPKYDLQRAKALLAAAGLPEGFSMQLNCTNNRYVNDEAICLAVSAMWAKIGVKVNLVAEPIAIFSPKMQSLALDAYMIGWGVSTFDAQNPLQALVRTRDKQGNGSTNFSGISDEELDRLIDEAQSEPNSVTREQLLRAALVRVRDGNLLIPIHYQVRKWFMTKCLSIAFRSDDRPHARLASMQLPPCSK